MNSLKQNLTKSSEILINRSTSPRPSTQASYFSRFYTRNGKILFSVAGLKDQKSYVRTMHSLYHNCDEAPSIDV